MVDRTSKIQRNDTAHILVLDYARGIPQRIQTFKPPRLSLGCNRGRLLIPKRYEIPLRLLHKHWKGADSFLSHRLEWNSTSRSSDPLAAL